MADKLRIPRFPSEADEAPWWFDHRDEVAKAFEEALPMEVCVPVP